MNTEYIGLLKTIRLFHGISEEDIPPLLTCLGAKHLTVPNGGFALRAGDKPEFVGVLLSGELQIVREDDKGGRTLLAALEPKDYFGEALAFASAESSPVSVAALKKSEVMLLPASRIMSACGNACGGHSALIKNIVGLLANKSLYLQRRMELLEIKTLRFRILAYLKAAERQAGKSFSLPFNRNALAEYLAADRSALSRELSRMKSDGIIDYDGNVFKLGTDIIS